MAVDVPLGAQFGRGFREFVDAPLASAPVAQRVDLYDERQQAVSTLAPKIQWLNVAEVLEASALDVLHADTAVRRLSADRTGHGCTAIADRKAARHRSAIKPVSR
jgi:hypothetical protein